MLRDSFEYMTTEVTLNEPAISAGSKLLQILVVSSLILVATFFGYKYLPVLMSSQIRDNGKLVALIVCGPVLALYSAITIGIRQPKQFSVSAEGIALGNAIAGKDFYPWHDVSEFTLCSNTKRLRLRVDRVELKETLNLKKFGVSQQQFEQIQKFASDKMG